MKQMKVGNRIHMPEGIDLHMRAGFILAQNDDGPLKWANGPYPIQIHANFQILKVHLKFLWALCKI